MQNQVSDLLDDKLGTLSVLLCNLLRLDSSRVLLTEGQVGLSKKKKEAINLDAEHTKSRKCAMYN
jgi:hypothetical protein